MRKALLAILLMSPLPAFSAVAVTGSSLLSILVTIVIVGLILWLIWWLISYIGLPQPFDKVARVLVALVAVIMIINLLLGFVGTPLFRF